MPFKTSSRGGFDPSVLDEIEPSFNLADAIFTPITTIFDILDTPGSVIRGLLAGETERAFSGIFNPEERVGGKELLGLKDQKGFLSTVAGIGAEIVTDPLLFMSSLTGLTRAGKAVAAQKELLSQMNIARKGVQEGVKGAEILYESLMKSPAFAAQSILNNPSRIIPDALQELSKVEEVSKGLRGIEFSIPFTKGEGFVPTALNEVLQPVLDATSSLIKKPFEYLNTLGPIKATTGAAQRAIETMFGKKVANAELKDLIDINSATIDAVGHEGLKARVELKKVYDDIIKDIPKGMSPEQFDETVANRIIDGEIDPDLMIPKRTAKWMTESRALNQTKLETTLIKLEAKRIKSLAEPDLLPDAKNAIQAKWVSRAQTAITKADKEDLDILEKVELIRADVSKAAGFINKFGELPDKFINEAKAAGMLDRVVAEKNAFITIAEEESYRGEYLPRVMSERGNKLHTVDPKFAKKFDQINNELIYSRRKTLRNSTLKEDNDFFKKHLSIDFDVYETNPVRYLAPRKLASELAIQKVHSANMAISLFAEPYAKGKVPEGTVELAQFLRQLKLTGFRNPATKEVVNWGILPDTIKGLDLAGVEQAHLKTIRSGLKKLNLEQRSIPKDVAETILRTERLVTGPFETLFREVFDPINAVFKTALTSTPAHTGQNVLSSMWSFLINGSDFRQILPAARQYAAYLAKYNPDAPAVVQSIFKKIAGNTTLDEAALEAAEAFGKIEKNLTNEATGRLFNPEQTSIVRPTSETIIPEAIRVGEKVAGKIGVKQVTQGFRDVNKFVEGAFKLAMYNDGIVKGLSPLQSGRRAVRYLFDYFDLTDFEKQYAKRAVLFYTFMRKNIPLAIQEMLFNRRAYAVSKIIDWTVDDREFVPDYVINAGQIGIGGDAYLNLQNPIYQANLFSPQGGGPQRVTDKLLNALTPIVRTPIEAYTGRETFRGIPVQSTGDLALRNLPTSRYQNTIAQFFSDTKTVPQAALGALTGATVSNIDPQKAYLFKLKQKLQMELEGNPEVGIFLDYYSRNKEPNEEIKAALDSYRAVNQSYRELFKR